MLESPEEKNEFTDKLKVNQTWQFESPVISTRFILGPFSLIVSEFKTGWVVTI